MVKIQALMESLSFNLHSFLEKINKNLPLPNKKFLRDAMIALLRTGKPIVCQMARQCCALTPAFGFGGIYYVNKPVEKPLSLSKFHLISNLTYCIIAT